MSKEFFDRFRVHTLSLFSLYADEISSEEILQKKDDR